MWVPSQLLYSSRPVADRTILPTLSPASLLPLLTSWLNNGAASLFERLGGSAGDVIRLVRGGQCCQKGVGGQRESCLQTVCVYIPDGERQLQRLLEVKGNALILLSNGKIQPNTSRNPDEKTQFIYLMGSCQCILGRKRNDFTDDFETSSMDRGMGKTE